MRKIVYALLSVVVAFGLWVYVITTVNPGYEETFYDIPVALANESALYDRGLMLDTEKIPTVTLKLSGNRSDIIKLNKSNITLVADLSRIYESGRQKVAYSISFPGDIPSNSIEILSKSVVEITLDIAKRNTYKNLGIIEKVFVKLRNNSLEHIREVVLKNTKRL